MIESLKFLNLGLGMYAFYSLLFLLLLYLIRPKLQEKTIPSLMFLMKDKSNIKLLAWFKKLIRDPLFFVQLLVLALLALSAIEPVMNYNKDVTSKNTILVLDVSASMRTGSRFNDMASKALEKVQGSTSIVLAEDKPLVMLKRGSASSAKSIIKGLKPKDTGSAIGDSIMVASDLLAGEEGKIVVISDFIDTKDAKLGEIKSFLENKGFFLEYIDVASKATNFGIIDYSDGKLYIKNFNNFKQTVTVQNNEKTQNLDLGPGSIEALAVNVQGTGKIAITTKDDLATDNTFYFAGPSGQKRKILLLTNSDKSYLQTLLAAMPDVDLETVKPPIVPAFRHDIVMMSQIDRNMLTVKTLKDLETYVKNGGSLIIVAQNNMPEYNSLLPVILNGMKNKTNVNAIVTNSFTKDLTFGSLDRHYAATNRENVVSIAVSDMNETLISFGNLGKGQILYYGLIEDYANIQFTPSYPLFWSNLFKFLMKESSFSDMNRKTGSLLTFTERKKVMTPSGEVTADSLILDEAGIYSYDNKQIAVNLLDEKESDVNKDANLDYATVNKKLGSSIVVAEFPAYVYLIGLAMIVVLLELLYIKVRGDI